MKPYGATKRSITKKWGDWACGCKRCNNISPWSKRKWSRAQKGRARQLGKIQANLTD